MSYYNTSSYSSSSSFYNVIKMKQSKDQPIDSVSTIVNDPYRSNEHNFAAAGWDGVLRYYRIVPKTTEEIQLVYSRNLQHPILSVALGDGSYAFAGLATGEIVAVDMANNQSGVIGTHNAPIAKLFWVHNFNLLLSLGYDNKLKFWDLSNQNNFLAKQFDLPEKTHTAAYDFPYLMIGSGNSKIGFINLSNLPNIKIPDNNTMFDIIEIGSKFTCSRILANQKIYALGCSDGRCIISFFEDGYQGPRPVNDANKKMNSKAMKKDASYSHTPLYGQINDIQVGFESNQEYLVLTGSEEIAFFNMRKRDKPKRIKSKGTASVLSLDGKYFIFAQGNDWSEGINDFKKSTKPKIEAVKFSKSQIDSFIEEKK